ncbi:hypothetical protein BGW39_007512 [Mortierella sp. 14UC]|nr:hypothetical protein BGW39_007512 [Mortierella sp. 14UC]
MKYRFCYPLIVPIRLLISLITLSNIICILVGKQLSKDTPPPSAPVDASTTAPNPQLNYDGTAATEKFFPDSEQVAINACLLAATLYMLYKPQTRFWWLTSNFRLTILSWGFAILGGYYALTQYIRIVTSNAGGGCGSRFFQFTRMQCWMQLGVSGGEVAWAVLLIWESFIMVKQKNDRKWNEQRADEEVQEAVMYQPDLTVLPVARTTGVRDNFDYDGRSSDALDMATGTGAGAGHGSEIIELGHLGARRDGSFGPTGATTAAVEEELPEYASRRPRNQPLIVDTAHPPRRLAGAVARRLQSESATHTLTTPSAPPSGIDFQEPPVASTTATASAAMTLPPPPSYTP